jgi:hypothetical protein
MMAKQTIKLLLVFWCAFAAHAASSPPRPGTLSDDVANLVERSIAIGWAPEQVKLLAGPPEFTEQFVGGIEVWRYRTSKDYLLVAFQDGKVSQVNRRPIPPETPKTTIETAVSQTAKAQPEPQYLPRIGDGLPPVSWTG